MAPLPETTLPSARFGQYTLREKIGEGGMAEIFRAEVIDAAGQLSTVILKLLKAETAGEFAELFDFEADLMGLLQHPNLVGRFEVGRAGTRRFLAMEDVFGGDTEQLMRAAQGQGNTVPASIALHIVIRMLKGLSAFHRARSKKGEPLGLVHSDVNPANVLISVDGEVKLADYGVATATQISGVDSGLLEGTTVGKLSYLSPEQAAGEAATAQSDLFSAGIMLYELLAGYRPFVADTEAELLDRIYLAKVDLSPFAGDPIADILQRSLARHSKDRFASAGELAGSLLTYQLDQDMQCGRQDLADYAAACFEIFT